MLSMGSSHREGSACTGDRLQTTAKNQHAAGETYTQTQRTPRTVFSAASPTWRELEGDRATSTATLPPEERRARPAAQSRFPARPAAARHAGPLPPPGSFQVSNFHWVTIPA